MDTKLKRRAFQALRSTFKVLHFAQQSAADITLETEARLLADNNPRSRNLCRNNRLASTIQMQADALDNYDRLSGKAKALFKNARANKDKDLSYSLR